MTRTCVLVKEIYENNRCWKLKKRIVHSKKYDDGLALEPNEGLVKSSWDKHTSPLLRFQERDREQKGG